MSDEPISEAARTYNQETQVLWDRKAAFWDELMGDEGNPFQRLLVGPATERLLDIQGGEMILDVACGNGVFTRRLAQLGAQVLGVDFSQEFLQLARGRTTDYDDRIDYQVVDATDEAALRQLGQQRFDAAVCNMALMDMATIDPLLRALRHLLKPAGRFVFSVQHPCFNSNAIKMVVEEEDQEGTLVEAFYLKFSDYLHIPPGRGAGAIGEPTPHLYFHRPLHVLFNACFQAGFVLDGIEEPAFDDSLQSERPLSWYNFKHFPPVLAARMRM